MPQAAGQQLQRGRAPASAGPLTEEVAWSIAAVWSGGGAVPTDFYITAITRCVWVCRQTQRLAAVCPHPLGDAAEEGHGAGQGPRGTGTCWPESLCSADTRALGRNRLPLP